MLRNSVEIDNAYPGLEFDIVAVSKYFNLSNPINTHDAFKRVL